MTFTCQFVRWETQSMLWEDITKVIRAFRKPGFIFVTNTALRYSDPKF